MTTGGENLGGLHHAFAATEFGQVLADRARYGAYKPADISDGRWSEVLGADVNNLTHLRLTHGLTKVFNKYARLEQPYLLDPYEEAILETSALTHDWAESIVGVKDFNENTEADKVEEKRQMLTNLDLFCGDQAPAIRQLVNEAIDTVVFSQQGKLALVFNSIERTGYLRTALRAVERSRQPELKDLSPSLLWLAADVLGNQPPVLMDYARRYKPIAIYITNQAATIDAAYDSVPENIFNRYSSAVKDARLGRFRESHLLWQRWRTANVTD